jgi:hypothetical protein
LFGKLKWHVLPLVFLVKVLLKEKDTADRVSLGSRNRLRALIAVSIPETARTVVRSLEIVSMLVRAPVLYLEDNTITTTEQKVIGIDISKDTLDVEIWDSEVFWQFDNNARGIQKLVWRLKKLSPALIVVEASGGLE